MKKCRHTWGYLWRKYSEMKVQHDGNLASQSIHILKVVLSLSFISNLDADFSPDKITSTLRVGFLPACPQWSRRGVRKPGWGGLSLMWNSYRILGVSPCFKEKVIIILQNAIFFFFPRTHAMPFENWLHNVFFINSFTSAKNPNKTESYFGEWS